MSAEAAETGAKVQIKVHGDAMAELRASDFPERQPVCWQRMVANQQVTVSKAMKTIVRMELNEQDALLLRGGLVAVNYSMTKQPIKERSDATQRTVLDVNRSILHLDESLKKSTLAEAK